MKQTPNQLESKRKWRRNHPEHLRAMDCAQKKTQTVVLRDKIYGHYGRQCACCGETEKFFLTIGHIGGWGGQHRKQVHKGRGGNTLAVMRDIIRRGYPDNIQIECANCNFGSFRNGGVCPHVKLRQAPISTA